LSVEAPQVRFVDVDVVPEAVRPVGPLGAVGSGVLAVGVVETSLLSGEIPVLLVAATL
jgi:hypothetical protein